MIKKLFLKMIFLQTLIVGIQLFAIAANAEVVEYYKHITPIINNYCVHCHSSQSSLVPFSLQNYSDVKKNAWKSLSAMEERRMPPFLQVGDGSCGEWRDNLWLPENSINIFRNWINQGMKIGKKEDETSVPNRPPSKLLPHEYDYEEEFGVGYIPTSKSEYRCFVLSYNHDKDMFIKNLEIDLSNRKDIHHIGLYKAKNTEFEKLKKLSDFDNVPGYACELNGAGYVQGGGKIHPQLFPLAGEGVYGVAKRAEDGLALKVEKNSYLLVLLHVMNINENADNIEYKIKLGHSENAGKYLSSINLTNTQIDLPPVEENKGKPIEFEKTVSVTGNNIWYLGNHSHMHFLGRSIKVDLIRNNKSLCLSEIKNWDANWEMDYKLIKPLRLKSGDKLKLTCVYENPTSKRVKYGPNTEDEMCESYLHITTGESSPY